MDRGCRKLSPHRKPQTCGDTGREQSEDRQEKVIGKLWQKGAPFQQNTFHPGAPCSRAGGMCLVRMCPIWLYQPYLPASQAFGRAACVADVLLEGLGCLPALLGGPPPCGIHVPLPCGTHAALRLFPTLSRTALMRTRMSFRHRSESPCPPRTICGYGH